MSNITLACKFLRRRREGNGILMKRIDRLLLNNTLNNLTCVFNNKTNIVLSYEYLRVFSPTEMKKKQSEMPQVFHKKNVKLIAIEPLGKHGYRLLFDDNYGDIFTDANLITLAQNYSTLWYNYKATLTNINNRNESISVRNLT